MLIGHIWRHGLGYYMCDVQLSRRLTNDTFPLAAFGKFGSLAYQRFGQTILAHQRSSHIMSRIPEKLSLLL